MTLDTQLRLETCLSVIGTITLTGTSKLCLYLDRKNRDRRSSESLGGNHQDTDRPGRSEPPPDPADLGTAGIGGKHPALSPHSLRL